MVRVTEKSTRQNNRQARIQGIPAPMACTALHPRSPRGPGIFCPVALKASRCEHRSLAQRSRRRTHGFGVREAIVRPACNKKNDCVSREQRCPPTTSGRSRTPLAHEGGMTKKDAGDLADRKRNIFRCRSGQGFTNEKRATKLALGAGDFGPKNAWRDSKRDGDRKHSRPTGK